MANLNASMSVVPSESLEQKGSLMVDSNVNVLQPPMNQPKRTSSDGHVAIFWDIENCPVLSDVRPEDVAGIRMALSAPYVPNGRKDAADKAILVDMFLFALDNPPPSSIMLISGDVDFAPALHILGQRGYIVILVIPAGSVSSALCNAGKYVWDWPSVARGEGFVPHSKALMPPRGGPADISGCFMGCNIRQSRRPKRGRAIVYKGVSQSCYNSRDFTCVLRSLSEYTSNPSVAEPSFPTTLRSHSLPSGLNEVPGCPGFYDQNNIMWVQPGDINGLKGQLVKLLELSGGCIPLIRIPAEYNKFFGRPLYVAEYGACKLVNLFKKMGDTVAIEGKGHKKFVYLRNWKASPSAPPLVLTRKDKKGKGIHEEITDVTAGAGSSDEISDEERVVIEEHDERRNNGRTKFGAARCDVDDRNLTQFKYELQEILVSYSCRIFLGYFEEVYQQRYKDTGLSEARCRMEECLTR
ncbi:putative receptor-like protein kinase [Hibiscus syriacus]|uniref:Receptor-like protein kinase n=1 Tax=Hibiscus syriacus TaxID=106335 RepID=A0A6A2ZL76_HIBSY|nr:putative receptor-like protein kinase [Hibiscus syriacus]